MLIADLAERKGAFGLAVEFTALPGEVTVLVGESGAGKTSILRLLAGLSRPGGGHIILDDEVYADVAKGVWQPAWKRDVGYVAQDFALFPHLTVSNNVSFGLRALGVPSGERRARVEDSLRRAGVAELGGRLPAQLSGGQQQRVALARALVLRPRLLLLDEPLSALDIQTRRQLRGELRALLRELPCVTVYVTHSPLEALVFGDRIVVVDDGKISQAGSRAELLRRPRSRYVAELIGTNLLVGRQATMVTAGPRVRTADGMLEISGGPGEGAVFAAVSPREITLSRERPEGSAQNVFVGPVLELVPEPPAGERVRVVLGTDPPLVAEVTEASVAALGLEEGVTVHAAFKATGVTTYT
jgi:molybdate transport system ATP-binding protein